MSDKRNQIKEYFEAPKPSFPTKALLIGIVVLIIGIAIGEAVTIIIGLLLGAGIIIFPILSYNKAKQRFEARPSDRQMDAWLIEDFQHIIDKDALDKLGLDKDELIKDSLVIPGPVFWSVNGINTDEVVRRLGNDNYFRYSVWNVEVFLFTQNYLANYGCTYNWLRNTSVNEHTNEFFYKDVVSVKTATESSAYTLKDGKRMEHSQTFQLNLSGDQVTVVTNDENLKTSSEMISQVDKAVQSIRTMLREKKA